MPISGNNFNDTDPQYHVITTKHQFMNQIGLGAFTTGTFYKWLQVPSNFDILKQDQETIEQVFSRILNPNSNSVSIQVWSKNDNNYISYNPFDQDYTIPNDQAIISKYSDLKLIDFNNKTIYSTLANTADVNLGFVTSIAYKNLETNYSGPLQQLIESNNYFRFKELRETGNLSSDWRDDKIRGVNGDIDIDAQRARNIANYISTLNTSEIGIQWNLSIPVTFNLNGKIPKTENVTFELRLFDEETTRKNERSVTFVNINNKIIGNVKSLADSKNTINQGGGIVSVSDPIAANMAYHYDQISNEFRSGTQQIVGIIAGGYPTGVRPPTDRSKVGSSGFTLTDKILPATVPGYTVLRDTLDTLKDRIIPTYGEAIVFGSQGGLPDVVTAIKNSDPCNPQNSTDTKKVHVPVKNIANRSWEEGTTVILQKIEGEEWIPLEIGAGPQTIASTEAGGEWQFTYLMANKDNYFRVFDNNGNPVENSQYTPNGYESMFRKHYYKTYFYKMSNDQQKQQDAALNLGLPTGDIPSIQLTYSSDVPYIQITSFDYMAKNTGGVNGEGHSISQTVFEKKYNYGDFEDGGKKRYGFECQYFGAVFPDGYKLEGKESYFDSITGGLTLEPKNDYDDNKSFFSSDIKFQNGERYMPFVKGLNRNWLGNSSEGIFGDAAQNNNLLMLPADIATNSDINSKFGGPILKVRQLETMHNIAINPVTELYDNVNSYLYNNNNPYLNRWSWLEKLSKVSLPVYDMEPITKNKIQFRPLSIENYTAYEGNLTFDTIFRYDSNSIIPHIVKSFGKYARNKVDGTNPYSSNALRRSDFTCYNDTGFDSDCQQNQGNIIRYGASSQGNPPFLLMNPKLGTSYGHKYQTSYNSNLNIIDVWDSDFAYEPAGAIGVIGASCVINTNQSVVNSNVKVYMGINNGVVTTITQNDPIQVVGGAVLGFGTGGDKTSWGGQNTPQAFNTTALHARVFHYWPRKLTVHDPRFFAVFHYAPGIEKITEKMKEVKGDWYMNGSIMDDDKIKEWNQRNQNRIQKGNNDNDLYFTYQKSDNPYWVPNVEYDSDYRVPTSYGGTVLDTGHIYRDTANIRDAQDWFVEPKVRGKLLPFKYYQRTIGVGADVFVKSGGTGYKNGDTFTTIGGSGKGVLITVKDLSDGILTASNLYLTDKGYNFTPDNFNNIADNYQNNSTKVKLKPLNVSGKGADIFVLKGECYDKQSEYTGPLESLGVTALAPETTGGGIIDVDQFSTALALNNLQDQGKYRMFLHFHNDVSHTMYYPDYGSLLPTYQQHITLTIG